MSKVGVIFKSVVLAQVVLAGCSAPTDLGKPCTLVRRDPTDTDATDGIRSIFVKESEVIGGKDYISFGATECEDLVCVREAGALPSGNPGADAKGSCSRACAPSNADACPPADENIKLSCRALILDEATIGAICQANPAKCKQVFGDNRSPNFCSRGAGPDGGS